MNGLILTIGYFKRPTKNNRFVPIFNIFSSVMYSISNSCGAFPRFRCRRQKYYQNERG